MSGMSSIKPNPEVKSAFRGIRSVTIAFLAHDLTTLMTTSLTPHPVWLSALFLQEFLGVSPRDVLTWVQQAAMETQPSGDNPKDFLLPSVPLFQWLFKQHKTVPLGLQRKAYPLAPLVLCVEDNVMTQQLLGQLLIRQQWPVSLVGSGEAALTYLTQCAPDELPQVITVDVGLPGMTGLAFIHALKRSQRVQHIPCVVVSGIEAEDRAKLAQLGITHVLPKPFSKAALIDCLTQALKNSP